uniref:26S proteasome non-ATPase regulatory subunit 6 n=4 Tax=Wuchereria bancrofti TaxID=6293 RepID=A0A1I8EV60_WUCBA
MYEMIEKAPGTTKQLIDDVEKEVISKIPNLDIAQLRFLLSHNDIDSKVKKDSWEKLIELIKENEMGPYYKLICTEIGTTMNESLFTDLKEANEKRLKEIDDEIADAEQNLGESEVRQAYLRKSEYLCKIGDKDAAVASFRQTYEKTVGIGYRIDLIFNLIRLGLFFLDHQLINANIAKAKNLMEQGGDWERKNRLRSYEGLYKMSVRDLKGAAALFLEAVPTFGSYELMTYEQLIFYTVISAVYALERPDLRTKVIRCNEIQEQLTGGGENNELTSVKQYLEAFYGCRYDELFVVLAKLEREKLKFDRYLAPHYNFYSRAMRLKAYEQFLTPYKTVRLDMMAKDFGVSKAFIDKELHRLIATGQLHCRIDAVRGIIIMNHPDTKNHLYRSVIKDGDILLNRIQKLARVINA